MRRRAKLHFVQIRRMPVPLAIVLALLLSGPTAGTEALGPAPRNEGGRFENPGGTLSHGGIGVRFPFFLRRVAGSFRARPGAPGLVANDGAFLRENALHSRPTVTWIGHSTLLVQMGHTNFLTDPTWSDTASPVPFAGPRRFVPPGLALEDLPPIDFVVVSHNHYDHLDLGSLSALAKRSSETRFLVPLGNAKLLRKRGIENVEELDWGERTRQGDVEILCLPAKHWSRRGLRDQDRALWSSWAVVAADRRFYFAGDTGYFSGFDTIGRTHGPFDLVAVPIGAYEPAAMMAESHLDPEQAVRASRDLRARRALAMHYGTFDLSDEPLDEPPRRFLAAGEADGAANGEHWVFEIGETRKF